MSGKTIAFVINPIAGMGGKVGLKGTDGKDGDARALGAVPASGERALAAMKALREFLNGQGAPQAPRFVTCSGTMGAECLENAGFATDSVEIIYTCGNNTTAQDTRAFCKFLVDREKGDASPDLVLFCGGDGTARDIFEAVGTRFPLLGIPAGVKMHSAVFGVSSRGIAELLLDFLRGRSGAADAELIDLDEEKYRHGEWALRMCGMARTLDEPALVQGGKMMGDEVSDDEALRDIAQYVAEMVQDEPDAVYILGPGSTVEAVAKKIGVEKTILGVDVVLRAKVLARDAGEKEILKILAGHEKAKIILSPIGAQGFVLGRGNLQISSNVVRKVGVENIIVAATPAKLQRTPVLRVDTGDDALDDEFRRRALYVVNGYRSRIIKSVQ